MQALNILIAGDGDNFDNIKNSAYAKKIYTTKEIEGGICITFNTFRELAQKCKALQIDLVIVENEKWVLQGIADVLRLNYINCIGINSNWTKVLNKSVLNRYDILTPLTLTLPEFPLIVKSGTYLKKANSVTEMIDIRESFLNISSDVAANIMLEEYIQGMKHKVYSIFDGKHLIYFPIKNLTEIQRERLNEYNKKLETLLNCEKITFTGFINSELIWHDNRFYNIGFGFEFPKPNSEIDLLYILISAIYQKLNEINFN